ncbi:MAG TPA: hypothetical protein VFN05_00250 [Actinomycetes bacterium]|nr:hypothetical protein [Actinomycetes bacterium]
MRLNGQIYEAVHALLERRRPLDLHHSAIEVRLPEGRFVIENSWPIPDADGRSRGMVVEGPVASRRLARLRAFRYEVRRWRDGVIPDLAEAAASPQPLSDDPHQARCLLDLVGSLPTPAWGRDELATGEMWNSNSVVAWLLTRTGLPTDASPPPAAAPPAGTPASSPPAAGMTDRCWRSSAVILPGGAGLVSSGGGRGRTRRGRRPDVVPGPLDPAVLAVLVAEALAACSSRRSASHGPAVEPDGRDDSR